MSSSEPACKNGPCRLVVLVSGGGTNLQSLIDACANGTVDGRIVAVVSNKPGAGGLARAEAAGIPTLTLDHRQYPDRENFDAALRDAIAPYDPSLVVLAGFMRILTPGFVAAFRGRLVNIHPSLLPLYPGLDTHRRAIEAGDREAGATVHFVTEALDGGPAIVRARVPVLPDDTPESLAARVLEQEHRIYPYAAKLFCEGRLAMAEDHVQLDSRPLPATGLDFTNA